MATIGVSKPYYALYSNEGETVTYSKGAILAKAVEFSAEIENAEDNNLYADNGIAESDRSFAGGTLTITTDDLTQEASAAIMGLTATPVTIESVTEEGVTELVYGEAQEVPYLGFGIIIKKKMNGAYRYRAIVFTKILFSIPSDAATTQGETIEWQTPELTATIMRDDTAAHNWKREATFSTEAAAAAYIQNRLSITAAVA